MTGSETFRVLLVDDPELASIVAEFELLWLLAENVGQVLSRNIRMSLVVKVAMINSPRWPA